MRTRRLPIDSIRVLPDRRAIDPEKIAELVESIRTIGLLHPPTISEDCVLIAGLHRIEAARRLGWTEIDCLTFEMGEVERQLAELDENLVRVELHYTDRGDALDRRKELYEALHPETKHGGAAGKAGGGKRTKDETVSSFADNTARRINTSPRTVQHDVQVARAFSPAEKGVLKDTGLPKRDAIRLARQPEELRRAAVAKIAAGEASNAGDAIREVLRDEDRSRVVNVQSLTGRFRTILIDPPWDYSDVGDEDVAGRSAPKYSRMSIEEIALLPVDRHAEDDAHLYLWTTNRMIPLSFDLFEKWGFRYITMLTWCKPHFGLGNYFRNSTEHVLFGVRGKLPLLVTDQPTHFLAPRGAHSAKPHDFYEIIERASPGPRLEMFARDERKGWISWGAGVEAA